MDSKIIATADNIIYLGVNKAQTRTEHRQKNLIGQQTLLRPATNF